jgi:transcription-silencing protein Clr2 (cryptic loci regulator)
MDLSANPTESQENVTQQAQWKTGPTKGPNGYNGTGEHFRVVGSVIGIKNSDGVGDHLPREDQRQRRMDKEGIFSFYEQQDKDSDMYRDWMWKIGPYLADWVLGLPRNGAFFTSLQLFFVLVLIRWADLLENPPWRLLRLPENYTLWVHKKGSEADPANPRIDAYLYGAPHLSPRTRFRSPMEFVPHAIWLMRGSTGQCDCQYCMPGQNQTDINRRLNHGVDDPDDESVQNDNDEDGGSGSGGSTGTTNGRSSSASRRRGASAGARRARRARRDRSQPTMIKAKDYRVGMNGDRDPGPGGPSSAT